MERKEKEYYLFVQRYRYEKLSKKQKGEILDEIQEKLGVCRRQALRLVKKREQGRPKKKRVGRRSKYQSIEFKKALKEIWVLHDYACSGILKAGMETWVNAREEVRDKYDNEIKGLLLSISRPTIDRVLHDYKKNKGKSTTHSGGFKEEIPVQKNIWDVNIPGYVEADTVAHCGGSLAGEFIYSYTTVDIATLWTEVRGIYGKGSLVAVKAFEDIEDSLPFDLLGYDSDNGTEMMNQYMYKYLTTEREERGRSEVTVTRARAYHSNDNAHVEQRNNSVARKYLGYERYGFKELQPLINYTYKYVLCPLLNHFCSVYKLKDKILAKHRKNRIYGTPEKPYEKIINSDYVSQERKDILKELHDALNPVLLHYKKQKLFEQIDLANKELQKGNCSTRLLTLPPIPNEFLIYERKLKAIYEQNRGKIKLYKS